jgi:hypothetical protein
LAKASPSVVLSPPNTAKVLTGRKPIEANICQVLKEAWQKGFTTKSDFAREFADYVSIAACMGWVTTRIFPPDVWGSTWQITSKGLLALEELYGISTEEDTTEED